MPDPFTADPQRFEANAYIMPTAHTAFSWNFFHSLTFASVMDLDFPVIAQPGYVQHFSFEPEIPLSAASTVIRTSETVPHISDIQPILAQLEDEYLRGNRSVKLWVLGRVELIHFSKIRLFLIINNHSKAVKTSRMLSAVVQQLRMSSEDMQLFRNSKITTPLCGFYGTGLNFPLWQVYDGLMDEEWLADDILNAHMELLYFRKMSIESESRLDSSMIIFLPIHFMLKHLETTFMLCFLHYLDHHYTAYIYQSASLTLLYGDSLGHTLDRTVQEILEWVLTDISSIKHIHAGEIHQQPTSGPGSGSCGVAAFNFLHRRCIAGITPWSPANSNKIRRAMLQDLIEYHLIATKKIQDADNWYKPALFPDTEKLESQGTINTQVYAYKDCNRVLPNNQHPIYKFLASKSPLLLPTAPFIDELPAVDTINNLFNGHDINDRTLPFVDQLHSASLLPPISLGPSRSKIYETLLSSDDEKIIQKPSLRKRKSILLSPTSPSDCRKWTHRNPSATAQIVKAEPDVISLITPTSSPTKLDPDIIIISPCRPKIKRDDSLESSPGFVLLSSPPKSEEKAFAFSRTSVDPKSHRGIVCGSIFKSLEDARDFIYKEEEQNGHKWVIGTTKVKSGVITRQTLSCNRRRIHKPVHDQTIDPADFRQGRSIKTGCQAHINVVRDGTGLWRLSIVDLEHNHDRSIPVGGVAAHYPTPDQRNFISNLATLPDARFSRSQVAATMKIQTAEDGLKRWERPLEPRQITNIMNSARKQASNDIAALGGEVKAILRKIENLSRDEPGWRYRIRVDDTGTVTGIFWQSPLQKTEDIASFEWVLLCYIGDSPDDSIPAPEVFASDRHQSLIAAVSNRLSFTYHVYCLHHLEGNVDKNLRLSLGADWREFNSAFWNMYHAVSPEHFDSLWEKLITSFPIAEPYLSRELHPCREHWASCWSTQEMIKARDSSRRQHDQSIESPYALQVCFKQMQESVYYVATEIQRPEGVRDWNEYAVVVEEELGYQQNAHEKTGMLDGFENDEAYISTKWLLRLINQQKLNVKKLIKVQRSGTARGIHYLTILADGLVICDCCYNLNIGIPCQHYFHIFTRVQGLTFSIGMIRARLPPSHQANPIDIREDKLQQQRPTETVSARTVFHETNAVLRPVLDTIQTHEQLDELISSLVNLRKEKEAEEQADVLKDPPVSNPKGRPRAARITGAIEGRARGGGDAQQVSYDKPICIWGHSVQLWLFKAKLRE
ncbi:hypothetical protein C8R42DRAFT_647375 [Lentinula raphanica]|nr:hypothetical protein C8R42DRAFT_647375 [Lentinula raphanica]